MTINNKKKETEANNYMLELHNSIDARHVRVHTLARFARRSFLSLPERRMVRLTGGTGLYDPCSFAPLCAGGRDFVDRQEESTTGLLLYVQ